MNVQFSNHSTRLHKSYGEQRIAVECNAKIGSETYKITYYRSPITGSLESLICEEKEITNENTLTSTAVRDYCWDELDK